MSRGWDEAALHALRRLASDVTTLAASTDVLARRHPDDPAARRAQRAAVRAQQTLSGLIDDLRQ